MDVEGCPLPEDRWYDLENDVWWLPDPGGGAGRLGLLAPLVAFAGRFVSVTFRPVSGRLERGRSIATVESVRYIGAVRLPFDGTPVAVNEAVRTRPKLLNDHPYDDGWVARVAPDDPAAPTATLAPAAAIADRLAERIRAQRIHCAPATPDGELYEIGAECQAILVRLDEELARRAPEEVVLLVTDDPTSPIEMVRWSDRTGHPVIDHRVDGTLHRFLVRRERAPAPRPPRRG